MITSPRNATAWSTPATVLAPPPIRSAAHRGRRYCPVVGDVTQIGVTHLDEGLVREICDSDGVDRG
jgi:hypothetical protein